MLEAVGLSGIATTFEDRFDSLTTTHQRTGPVVKLADLEVVTAAMSSACDAKDFPAQVDSVQDRTLGVRTNPTLTPDAFIRNVIRAGVRFFCDQHGATFVWITVHGPQTHNECLKLRSKQCRSRLVELIRQRTGAYPTPKILRQAIELMELIASTSERRELSNRCALQGDEILIDVGDSEWREISVTKSGWCVRGQRDPVFFRTQHSRELPIPQSGGDFNRLFDFVPVESTSERLLVLAWTVAAFYPLVPNPMLLFVGEQGSAKTTRSLRLRSLLDPSITPALGEVEMRNLAQVFQHHAVPCFENVSRFNRRVADLFCRAVTGDGVERRKLFTDSDQVLFAFRRPIIINGVEIPSTRPDFLDRCLIINCHRLTNYKTLGELDREFGAFRPRLLGALLDLLVKTLGILEDTPPATEFRMADFATFGRAVAIASGATPTAFDEALRQNIRHKELDVIEDSPIIRPLKRFAAGHPSEKPWRGTAEQLLHGLFEMIGQMDDPFAKRDLPQSARWLSSRLSQLAPLLVNHGLVIEKLQRTNTSRLWQVSSSTNIAGDEPGETNGLWKGGSND